MDLAVPSLTCVAGSKVDDDEHDKGGGGGNDDISLGLGFLGGGRLGFRLVWTACEDEMFACGCAAHMKKYCSQTSRCMRATQSHAKSPSAKLISVLVVRHTLFCFISHEFQCIYFCGKIQ